MKCGLLGSKLSHSFSPKIHSYFGNYDYKLFEIDENSIEDFFQRRNFDAINVTIPYKEIAIKFCENLDEISKKTGVINTIINKNGTLFGYNTDYYGFKKTLEELNITSLNQEKVLVLGSGGSSKTVCHVISELGGLPIVISRKGINNYDNISQHYINTFAIINTTPVGMYPKNLESLIEISYFSNLNFVVDLIYNPAKTKFILDAEKFSIPCKNGLLMLVYQAKASNEIFTETKISEKCVKNIINKIEIFQKNIVLIGMPGSGKTTIGKNLAKRINRNFVDIDDKIEISENFPTAEIILKKGEQFFREIETKALAKFCSESNLVISTGGGSVLADINYDIIRQNSVVIWLKRRIENLDKTNRPLSLKNDNSLYEMSQYREKYYKKYLDFEIENNDNIENTVEKIVNVLKLC